MASFAPLEGRVNFPDLEQQVLDYWKSNQIFEKSVQAREGSEKWTFLDGPPFITGMPHYGTLLSSLPKDLFPRYKTMKGYQVRRVWGWDCHGLPAENKVENQLGIKSKREIEEKVGVAKFIDACKAYVNQVSSEWEWYVDHIGRWVDFKNAYRTMDTEYMESVMWVFKQMYDQGHIYKGLRVSLFCPHCSTPISNFEVAMDAADNYREVTEPATTYKYQLKDQPNTYILAWSTTPWNKLVTPALAVNPTLQYVKVKQGKEFYILAETTLHILLDEPYEIVETFTGQKLINLEFIPHYNFYDIEPGKKAFIIIAGDFVTAEEGTGVVTIAAYGEDDLRVMKEQNIQIALHVNEEGYLKENVPNGWAGKYYLEVDPLVNQDLASRGLVYREDPYPHRVPHCWRCHTRLLYAPQDAWFVDIQKLKPQLLDSNKQINWVPEHFKHGRFQKSLESAPDWCISRSRYWGSPVPVWECECGEHIVPGSISELEELSGQEIKDLHKPGIDQVTIPCPKCSKPAHRVTEVLDSWIEAGSASFAERHFPFENYRHPERSEATKEQTKSKDPQLNTTGHPLSVHQINPKDLDFFPPDFIVEYTGQIRAWFYVLHVIGNSLFQSPAFKNVLVTGVILGTDGRKMSKNYGNYPDPKEMLQKYGGDALRLYLLGTPVMNGEDIRISEQDYQIWVRNYLNTLYNSFKFFTIYANRDNWQPSQALKDQFKSSDVEIPQSENILDKWILSKLAELEVEVSTNIEQYQTPPVVAALQQFINDLSTWYIRRSRDRGGETSFYETLYFTLVTFSKISAPVTPFISDIIYRHLTGHESVHLTDWPKLPSGLQNSELETQMEVIRLAIERGHAARKETNIPVRQPLSSITVDTNNPISNSNLDELIADELNVKKVLWNKSKTNLEVSLDTTITPELKAEGDARNIIRQIQMARKKAGCELTEKVTVTLPDWPKDFEDHIKQQTLAKELVKGEELQIKRSSS